ncbi:CapA family protein [Actinomycetota bacterium]
MPRPLPTAAALSAALLLAAGVALAVDTKGAAGPSAAPSPTLTGPVGRVVDEGGRPVSGAQVQSPGGATVSTDADGRFPVTTPGVFTASAPGRLPRAGVGSPDALPRLVLPRAADTVSMRFGGDVMAGRRFYEKHDGRPAHLTTASTASDHAALLARVRPLLEDSDVTVVNLETPLIDDPYFPADKRPKNIHPTKDLAFASAIQTAQALRDNGIDIVDLGNNHSFDALDRGLASTVSALDRAGVAHTGAGRNEAEAWKPAVTTVRGRKIALVSCTTVTGRAEKIPYVAGPNRAGAAECSPERLASAVREARASGATVTAMIHGHVEYERDQVEVVRSLTRVAAESGASAVMNGHPHVIGGLTTEGRAVVSETMGNLLFDQTVWSTFLSYLVRVDLAADGSATAGTDPIVLEDYLPQPATGALADASARIAAGTVPGASLGTTGATATTRAAAPSGPRRTQPHALPAGVSRLPAGSWLATSQDVRAGQDLLWGTGDFEQRDVQAEAKTAPLWSLGSYAKVSPAAVCSGTDGVDLLRSPVSSKDVFVSSAHRVTVRPGDKISLIVDVRAATEGAKAELRWYSGSEGSSSHTTTLAIEPRGDDPACQRVRLDAVVPKGANAVQPFVRLSPPKSTTTSARLAVDGIRLVQWAKEGSTGRIYDTVESDSSRTVQLGRDD